ncbi:signal peptidase I [Natrialba swarupiae]|nr:signal peptidase I [Natrialba swarupiae]
MLVLIAIVVPFVIYAVPGVIGAEYSFVVLTGSMAPAIDPGDVVIVGETEPTTIESGDVITFVRDGADTPVTHRVVGWPMLAANSPSRRKATPTAKSMQEWFRRATSSASSSSRYPISAT